MNDNDVVDGYAEMLGEVIALTMAVVLLWAPPLLLIAAARSVYHWIVGP